jgi:hypothetical protein
MEEMNIKKNRDKNIATSIIANVIYIKIIKYLYGIKIKGEEIRKTNIDNLKPICSIFIYQ